LGAPAGLREAVLLGPGTAGGASGRPGPGVAEDALATVAAAEETQAARTGIPRALGRVAGLGAGDGTAVVGGGEVGPGAGGGAAGGGKGPQVVEGSPGALGCIAAEE